jgi:two-component system, chemotaxis family, sensor histidine kinase and response regulator WspE
MSGAADFENDSMIELFRVDAEGQVKTLTEGLLALERNPTDPEQLEAVMRAAHSLKGAGRIVGITPVVRVAHALEDCFVAAQKGTLRISQTHTDTFLTGVDLLARLALTPEHEIPMLESREAANIERFLAELARTLSNQASSGEQEPALPNEPAKAPRPPQPLLHTSIEEREPPEPSGQTAAHDPDQGMTPEPVAEPSGKQEKTSRVLRVTADNLDRLLGLAGESLVESKRLGRFSNSLLQLKRMQNDLMKELVQMRDALSKETTVADLHEKLTNALRRADACREFVLDRSVEMDANDRLFTNLSNRLYGEALSCRMRPIVDGTAGFHRMVREIGRSLGKKVRLEIIGESTQVDRDILERLEAPLGHLLRNAIDHGIESPEERRQLGKPEEGTLCLEARHSAGMLLVSVSDDGRGLSPQELRQQVTTRNLTDASTAEKLTEAELLEFLFLPGFSMKNAVTEISGRGVGLDVVQTMVKTVRGSVRVFAQPGTGMRFQLQLPLTLSVVRTLLVEISREPYAFPLAYLTCSLKVPIHSVQTVENRQHFEYAGQQVGLVWARQLLGSPDTPGSSEDLSVVIVGEQRERFGIVVERFLGERELVVQKLDPRLGKIKDIAAGALMEDGSPVLIVDVEDLISSTKRIIATDRLRKIDHRSGDDRQIKRKRVLVVDDSLTVRELERKLLENHGYEVTVAVDGLEGWNMARSESFDLVITDVDMPRLDGIELVKRIKHEEDFASLPVMIVSYKDREEDRRRGLDAGADYYLTKSSFHDDTLLEAVVDLIGKATS